MRLVYAETAFMHSEHMSILEFANMKDLRYPYLVLLL